MFHVGVIKSSISRSSDRRPRVPQVRETMCEESQGGHAIDDIKEQFIRGIESEVEREMVDHNHKAMNSHRTLRAPSNSNV